jgi:hypothetical protein
MAEIIALIFLIPAAAITLTALLIAITHLWSQRTSQASQTLDKLPGRSFIIGFVNFFWHFGCISLPTG